MIDGVQDFWFLLCFLGKLKALNIHSTPTSTVEVISIILAD